MQQSKTYKLKKTQVIAMFNAISHRYDLLNHLLSLNLDNYWRANAIKMLSDGNNNTILDIATGTGDLAFFALKYLSAKKIIAIDIAEKMLHKAQKKAKKKDVHQIIDFQHGDAEKLCFKDKSFQTVISSFGIRNFVDIEKSFAEMHRVLQYNGKLMLLEFTIPTKSIFTGIFQWYFKHILPKIGHKIAKHATAYQYLFSSVQNFYSPHNIMLLLKKCSFKNIQIVPLTKGVVTVFLAEK